MILSIFQPDGQIISALVWTLIHSIWQFGIIALLMSVLLKIYQQGKSTLKYYIALGSLTFAFLTAIFTYCYYYFENSGQDITLFVHNIGDYSPATFHENNLLLSLKSWIDQYQLPVFYTWMMGVVLFCIRFILSVIYVEFLSGTSSPIYCQETFKAFRRVCLHYKVSENITIGESKYVKSPMILGFIKPIILFPIGVINQLDISETEAILAHELAHFVRKDIYINIIQNLMEALLYYHPAIWWISANIKLERESCCDELAIGYMGNNIHYARTLVKMQEISQKGTAPALAMNFSKKESFFSNRIKRILNMTQTRNYLKEKIITSIVLIAVLMFITKDMTGSSDNAAEKISKSDMPATEITVTIADTLPYKKESVKIQKKTDDKEVKLSIENGEITELEIDGKKIDAKDYDQYTDIISEVKPRISNSSKNKMFYFDREAAEPFLFRYDSMDMDSMMRDFNISNYEFLQDLKGLDWDMMANRLPHMMQLDRGKLLEDKALSKEKMEQLRKELGNLKELNGQILGLPQEKMEQLRGEMGKLRGLQGQIMSKEKMEELRKELGNLKFNFEGLDSFRFNFDHFNFPEIREWQHGPDVKIYRHDKDGQDFNFDFNDHYRGLEFGKESENFSDAIGNSLNRDGLLIPGKENKVELTGKQLKINGEKQPNNIFQKYKRIFEETSGTTLEKNSKLQFNYTGKESKRKFKVY